MYGYLNNYQDNVPLIGTDIMADSDFLEMNMTGGPKL